MQFLSNGLWERNLFTRFETTNIQGEENMQAKKALWQLMGILVILAMVLAACQPAATPAPATEAPAPIETQVPAEAEAPSTGEMPAGEFPVMPGGELEKALAGEYT